MTIFPLSDTLNEKNRGNKYIVAEVIFVSIPYPGMKRFAFQNGALNY